MAYSLAETSHDVQARPISRGRCADADPFRRSINRDPIEEDGGLNLYGFCLNDPVNRHDFLGMDPSRNDTIESRRQAEDAARNEAALNDKSKIPDNVTKADADKARRDGERAGAQAQRREAIREYGIAGATFHNGAGNKNVVQAKTQAYQRAHSGSLLASAADRAGDRFKSDYPMTASNGDKMAPGSLTPRRESEKTVKRTVEFEFEGEITITRFQRAKGLRGFFGFKDRTTEKVSGIVANISSEVSATFSYNDEGGLVTSVQDSGPATASFIHPEYGKVSFGLLGFGSLAGVESGQSSTLMIQMTNVMTRSWDNVKGATFRASFQSGAYLTGSLVGQSANYQFTPRIDQTKTKTVWFDPNE